MSRDAEIVVLRHRVAVPRRQVTVAGRWWAGRVVLAAPAGCCVAASSGRRA